MKICTICKELAHVNNFGLCSVCIEQVNSFGMIGDEVGDKQEKRGKCLPKAIDVINGERQDTYGAPEDSFKTIADYWSTYLDVELVPSDAMKMMVLFKIARMSGQEDKIDNYIDAAGYLGIAGDLL